MCRQALWHPQKEGGGARRPERKRYELCVFLGGNCMTALLARAPGVALRCHEALYLVYSMVWVLAVQIKSIKLIHGSVFLAGWGVGYTSCVVASPKALLSGRNRQPSLGIWPSAWTSEFMNAFSRKNIQIQYRPEKKNVDMVSRQMALERDQGLGHTLYTLSEFNIYLTVPGPLSFHP